MGARRPHIRHRAALRLRPGRATARNGTPRPAARRVRRVDQGRPAACVRATSGWHGAPPLEAYFDFSYDAALRSLEESLERLGLDRVDIALVHDPDDHYDEALAGAYRALARLRDEGVVRAIGVGMNQTRAALPLRTRGRSRLLPPRRPVHRCSTEARADELLPLCAERGIAVIAGGVFNSGVLAGGDTFDYEPATPDVLATRRAGCARPARRTDVPLAGSRAPVPAPPSGGRDASSSAAARRTRSRRTCACSTLELPHGALGGARVIVDAHQHFWDPGQRRISVDDRRASRRSGAVSGRRTSSRCCARTASTAPCSSRRAAHSTRRETLLEIAAATPFVARRRRLDRPHRRRSSGSSPISTASSSASGTRCRTSPTRPGSSGRRPARARRRRRRPGSSTTCSCARASCRPRSRRRGGTRA